MIKTLLLYVLFASAFCIREWPGLWSVIASDSGNYSLCDIPQSLSVVNITSNGETLTLEGLTTGSQSIKTWSLAWSRYQQFSSYCQDGWCVSGSIIYTIKATLANITWSKSNESGSGCSTLLTPISVGWTGDWLVLASQSETYCPVPIMMTLASIKAYGNQLLLVGNSTEIQMVSSWTLNFTSQEHHVRGACIGPLSVCVEADVSYLDHFVVGSLTWVADNYYDCNVVMIKIPAITIEMSNSTDLNAPESLKGLCSEMLISGAPWF